MSSASSQAVVLVVDDDRAICHLLKTWLEKEGYHVQTYADGQSCLAALQHTLPDAICLDLHMPGLGGRETLERIKSRHPLLPVLILTSDIQVDSVVGAMRLGAYDYLSKPVDHNDLSNRLRHAIDGYHMSLKLQHLERAVEGRPYPGLVGRTSAMIELYRQMDRLAGSDITLLIHGESGSGKELVGRAIHQQSGRRSGPFVPVNCAAIPETLQESELFGHEKGSFTGATNRRIGKFEQADRGTLFLDEIAELSLPAQAKLLRVLQERNFTRVGGSGELNSDFRLIAATHRDLAQRVRDTRFREDLYFRVAVFELEVPALRDRQADIPELSRTFLTEFAEGERRSGVRFSDEALATLCQYNWPGNVRELQNAVQRALVACEGEQIEVRHLPPRLLQALDPAVRSSDNGNPADTPPVSPPADSTEPRPGARRTLDELERDAITSALNRANGNLSRVCRELGIGRTTLYRKLKKYELR